jgi:hypothetical protein
MIKEARMRRLVSVVLGIALIFGIGIGTAAAATNSLKEGTLGLSVDVNNDFILQGRYFILNDFAVLGEFGFGIKGDDGEGTDIGLGVGIRKYLRTEDLAPFVGGTIFYSSTQDGDLKNFALLGIFGAEYFLHKQFSVEGSVGLGYSSEETKNAAGTTTTITNFGTQRFGLALNFYF